MSAVRHRPGIQRGVERGLRTWQFVCTCGAAGDPHHHRILAAMDMQRHVLDLPAVPEDQRCRVPRQHRVPHWEKCDLCADQIPLWLGW